MIEGKAGWFEKHGRLALGAGSTPDEPQELYVMPFTIADTAAERMRADAEYRKDMTREFTRIFTESFESLFTKD